MNIGTKIFSRILANGIQHDQVGFIPGIQGWFNIQKSLNILYYINILELLIDIVKIILPSLFTGSTVYQS